MLMAIRRLIAYQSARGDAPGGLILKIDAGERLAVAIAHKKPRAPPFATPLRSLVFGDFSAITRAQCV
jgi:hypothetical protein